MERERNRIIAEAQPESASSRLAVLTLHSGRGLVCARLKKERVMQLRKEDLPLQTLQHLPSGKICSLTVQLSSGQVSVTFTIRPLWMDRAEAGNDNYNDAE